MTEVRPIACETCFFWVLDKPGMSVGECHRHSPLATGGLHCEIETVWPLTAKATWCGDHAYNRET